MSRVEALRKEENAYRQVKSDAGKPLTYYYYHERMSPTVANVERFGSNELSEYSLKFFHVAGEKQSYQPLERKEPEKSISRLINGDLVFDMRSFGLISEKGTEDFEGLLRFSLREGPQDQSFAHHWPQTDDSKETIYFSLFVSADRFEWLWREMTLRSHGELRLLFSARVYQNEVEHHLAEPYHRQEYFIEPESHNPISEISFTVRDPYPVSIPKSLPATAEDLEDVRDPLSALNLDTWGTSTRALLRWIIVLQVLMLIAILAK